MIFLNGARRQLNFIHQKISNQSKKQTQKDNPQQIFLEIWRVQETWIRTIKFIRTTHLLDKDL